MKIIDSALANAFRQMRLEEGTATSMAKRLGLSKAHVGRILKGTTNYLSDETWTRIKPIITPYIRTDTMPALAHSVPLEVIDRIMASAASAEEKAAIIRELFVPHAEAQQSIPRPVKKSRHWPHGYDAIVCPQCGENIIIPKGAEKIAYPECGQRVAFAAFLENTPQKGEKK